MASLIREYIDLSEKHKKLVSNYNELKKERDELLSKYNKLDKLYNELLEKTKKECSDDTCKIEKTKPVEVFVEGTGVEHITEDIIIPVPCEYVDEKSDDNDETPTSVETIDEETPQVEEIEHNVEEEPKKSKRGGKRKKK